MAQQREKATINGVQADKVSYRKRKRIVYRVQDEIDAADQSDEFKMLVASLQQRARKVAAILRKRKDPHERKVIALSLCQHCGVIIPAGPDNRKRYFCGETCKQAGKRTRARFAAAKQLSRMHPMKRPAVFYVIIDVIDIVENKPRTMSVFGGTVVHMEAHDAEAKE